MGMSTTVVGFRPADDKWRKMKAIWENCEQANVPIPMEVNVFFDGMPPKDNPGAEVNIKDATKEWSNDYASGYEIDLTKLPKDVNILRFYNSW